MKKILLNCLFIVVSFNTLSQNTFVKDSLDIYIEREMKRWQVPGLAIAIVKDGKVVLTKGYGVTSIKDSKKVNEYTLFQIASNSKAFTGTAIAQLHEEKKIHLDSAATKYLPYFKLFEPSATQLCTVRDLLTHRIGHGTFQGDFLNWGSNLTRKEIVEKMSLTQPKYPFRYTYGYCNAGYIAAGEIILASSGLTWDEYLNTKYFQPLEMKHTNTSYTTMIADINACAPHTIYKGKLTQIPLANIDNMSASAAINSCAADMANWLIMQLNNGKFNGNSIVSSSVLRETRKSQMVVRDVNSKIFSGKHFNNYGLGWASSDYYGKRVYEHSGGANGFVTKTEFMPEENLGVLVYTNSDANSLYDALPKQIIEAYLNLPYRNLSQIYFDAGADSKASEKQVLDSLEKLASSKPQMPFNQKELLGYYQNAFYGKIALFEKKGILMMWMEHHPKNIATLSYLNENKFVTVYSDLTCGIELSTIKLENNQPKSITIKVNDFIDYESYEFEFMGIPKDVRFPPEIPR
jgi:CubicO group peptidase (beta-lactamase class C family)